MENVYCTISQQQPPLFVPLFRLSAVIAIVYLKYKSSRKGQRKLRRKFLGIQVPHRNTVQDSKNNWHVSRYETKLRHLGLMQEEWDYIGLQLKHSPQSFLSALHMKWECQKRQNYGKCDHTKPVLHSL
jgi:hypothetical protein